MESASFVSDEKVTLDDFSLEEILSYLDQKGYVVDVTLKEGIEKQLLNEFPELKGVRDLTEHQRGEHSYY